MKKHVGFAQAICFVLKTIPQGTQNRKEMTTITSLYVYEFLVGACSVRLQHKKG